MKFGEAKRPLGFRNGTGQDHNASVRCNGVNDLNIEGGLARPAFPVVVRVLRWHIEGRNDLKRNRRQAKLLIKGIYIALQRWAAKGDDVNDGLPLAGEAMFDERLYS